MKGKNSRLLRSKTIGAENSQSQSRKKINLRKIYKSRGSQSIVQGSQTAENREVTKCNQQSPQKNNRCFQDKIPSYRNNQVKKETIKLQMINKRSQILKHQEIMSKLEQLQKQAEELIKKKILKLTRRTQSITLKDKGNDQISSQIQGIIRRIRQLQSNDLDKFKFNQEQIKIVIDRKIKLLEKLIAQNSTESQVLKRYFFAISAINQRKKSSNKLRNNLWATHQDRKSYLESYKDRYLRSTSKQPEIVYNQSCNRLYYGHPKPDQYQTYRYKSKDFKLNVQPLPRSSYNREFIIYDPKSQKMSYKDLDHYTFLNSRMISSTYANDFKKMKTQVYNYKDLDSYRNKIKNLQISYIDKNKKKYDEEYVQKSRRYIAEQLKMKYNQKNIIKDEKNTQGSRIRGLANQNELISSRVSTQFKSQFKGAQQMQLSSMKNKQLQNLKYNYRSLINY